MTDKQPEALRLAECLDDLTYTTTKQAIEAAAELRRLHEENEALKAVLDDFTKVLAMRMK